MRALVFGSGGLLGNALVRRLSEAGFEVVALDHAACDITVGLRPTTVLMFSPLQVGTNVLSHSGRSAAMQASGIVA